MIYLTLRYIVKRFYGALIFLGLMVALLYVPMKLPFEGISIGRIWPAQEWRLVQDQTGRITSVIRDNRTGTARQIDAFQFEQGDISGLQLDVPDSGYVRVGDTIVRMYSVRQREEIQEIEAQLALYGAQLRADVTGDKPPIVQEAENQLRYAEQDLQVKEKNYRIQKQLLDQELVALTDFQFVENEYELAKIQVDIARKNLEDVATGIKMESVGVTEAQLKGLRNRLEILRQKGLSFVLRAPFSGHVQPSILPEELIILQQGDAYVVQIPVRVEQLRYLSPQTKLLITDMQTQKTYTGQLFSTNSKVEILDNRQVSIVNALVVPEQPGERLSVGISAHCVVRFDEINQREYLKRLLNFTWLQ